MDWRDLGATLIKAGAPIIGTAIGGPFGTLIGGALGNFLAGALGTDATPDAVNTAITNGDPSSVAAKLSAAETEAQARWPALAQMVQADAELGKAQVGAIGETMRAELNSGAWYQRAWRPFLMFTWGATWPFQLTAVLHHAYAKDAASLAELASLLYALAAWNAGPAGVAGRYAWGRTKETIADMVPLPGGGVIGNIVKAVVNRH